MANILVDTAATVTLREYMSTHLPNIEIESEFAHTRPADRPTEPSTAGLSAGDLVLVNAWKSGMVVPTDAEALAYVNSYIAYNAALAAWKFANKAARIAQSRIAIGDALIANKPTTSVSADDTGAGSDPPPHSVERGDLEP